MNFSNASTHFAATLTVGASTSYTPNWPSTVNSGDGIVLICFPDTASDVVNVPSGYTLKSIASNSIKIMTKVAGSSEAAPTITSSSSVQHGCLVLRVEACDLDSFTAAYGTGSGGSAWATPAVTAPSVDNLFFYGGLSTGGTSDWLTNDEPTITTLINQQAGTSMWFGVGYDQLTASGATGTRTPWDNTSGAKVTFAFTLAPGSAVTIDDAPTDNRVTESRTIRVTASSTAITTGNTSIYINADTNAAITPSLVTSVSGLTVDIDYTVPDEYAGLPYNATGYPIIVSTVDGDVTSANVPFLPVTGNGYITLTDVSAVDFDSDVAPAIGDQAEWTNDAVISLDSLGKITSSEAVTTFDLRLWDDTDDTWGDWAEQTWGSEADTAPTLSADASVNVPENTTTVGTYAATGTAPITYSLSGTDSSLFSINSSTGAVAFLSAPNYESGSNTKSITVTATNAFGGDTQDITVNITNVVEAPVMPADATLNVVVGATSVINTGADFVDGVITYTKSGANQALFSINSSTGALAFISPAVLGSYTVIRTATNSAGADSQTLTVQVITAVIGSKQTKGSIMIGIGI